jgi:epsin
LLEFLIKNGSERVIDDVRSHLSLIKMLRQFHYIDPNGKDQGINVRNRSKELTELLSDVDRIRTERKKARQNKNKYSGVEGGAGLGGSMSTSTNSRYGGFGSESAPGGYGGATRQVYGDGGGFGGETVQDDWEERSQSRSRGQDRFDEYDEYDEGSAAAAPSRRKAEPSRTGTKTSTSAAKKPEPPKPKEPEVDLFDFGDEPTSLAAPTMPAMSSNGKQPADDGFGALQSGGADDDDFDDFQSAAPAAAPAPALAAVPKPNYTPNYTAIAPPVSTASPNTQFAQPQPRHQQCCLQHTLLYHISCHWRSSSTTATKHCIANVGYSTTCRWIPGCTAQLLHICQCQPITASIYSGISWDQVADWRCSQAQGQW